MMTCEIAQNPIHGGGDFDIEISLKTRTLYVLKHYRAGEIPERPKGTDCKSVGIRLRRFESFSRHHVELVWRAVELRCAEPL